MCQSGQDPKEVNQLLETVLDDFWPLEKRNLAWSDPLHLALLALLSEFDLGTDKDCAVERWGYYEKKYEERFGEETCTRELDKFFLIKTIAEWED